MMNLKHNGKFIVSLHFVLILIVLLVSVQVVLADPVVSDPAYTHVINDCITGDNSFTAANAGGETRWYINQDPAFDNAWDRDNKCDTYQIDQYERPTSQTFEYVEAQTASADGEVTAGETVYATGKNDPAFYEYLDITRGYAHFDSQYMYFRIELYGTDKVGSDGSTTSDFGESSVYDIRLATNASANDASNGILITAENPKDLTDSPDGPSGGWKAKETSIYADTDSTVSGDGGVNDTKQDGDTNGLNGYDVTRAADGMDQDCNGDQIVWARRIVNSFSTGRPAVEFAFDYVAYNACYGPDILPADVTYMEFDATRGLKGNAHYLWNDKYNENEAGSPNPDPNGPNGDDHSEFGTQGTGNIYELDTLRGGFAPTAINLTGLFANISNADVAWIFGGFTILLVLSVMYLRRRKNTLNV